LNNTDNSKGIYGKPYVQASQHERSTDSNKHLLSASTAVGTYHLYSSGGSMSATPHNRGHDEPLTILDVVVQDKNYQCTSLKKYQDYDYCQ
jgi:hypothetical protein